MILVNGRNFEWREELTISAIMQAFNYTSPKIVVKVNDQVVRQTEWSSYVAQDGDDVRILHLIGGG